MSLFDAPQSVIVGVVRKEGLDGRSVDGVSNGSTPVAFMSSLQLLMVCILRGGGEHGCNCWDGGVLSIEPYIVSIIVGIPSSK